MKRMIALILCLVMVLGLFTGVVGAEEPEIGTLYADYTETWDGASPTQDLTGKTFLVGGQSFNLFYKDGETVTKITDFSSVSIVDSNGKAYSELGSLNQDTDSRGLFAWNLEPQWLFADHDWGKNLPNRNLDRNAQRGYFYRKVQR